MSDSAIVQAIRTKVAQIIAENRKLRTEAAKLTAERDRLKTDNRAMVHKIAELEKRIGVLEISGGMTGAGRNTKLARQRVNLLMREIDRCIALMNK
ncbi:MAG: hypothetical protein IJC16_00505 [Rikenellaceae bacterium]|nr:hypothetical protein [Rikenellaceae bacterium]